eukprot:1149471-Amphidinium_carterae.1
MLAALRSARRPYQRRRAKHNKLPRTLTHTHVRRMEISEWNPKAHPSEHVLNERERTSAPNE